MTQGMDLGSKKTWGETPGPLSMEGQSMPWGGSSPGGVHPGPNTLEGHVADRVQSVKSDLGARWQTPGLMPRNGMHLVGYSQCCLSLHGGLPALADPLG